MAEIKCPHCGQTFTPSVDEYNDIVAQIKEEELSKRVAEKVAAMKAEQTMEIERSKHELDVKIAELENKLKMAELEAEQAVKDEVKKAESEKALLESKQADAIKIALAESNKEKEELKHQLELERANLKLEVEKMSNANNEALAKREAEIQRLQRDVDDADGKMKVREAEFKERYDNMVKDKDEQIAHYKDFKMKLSTKMIGESLERYCSEQFESIRPTAFQNAYFDKDNEVIDGGKGDFIFRDYTPEGVEYISIMFEMKNEADETATKHKNEDFFDKLDRDRNNHNCEYAVLVSMLEPENEFYNQGIVDISYKAHHEKMYAIRPQNFIAIITLLRNAAMKNIQIKNELDLYKKQNIDVTNFEEDLEDFKARFVKNMTDATDRFDDAIDYIDTTIKNLTKVRENLVKSAGHLGKANSKLEELTVKKLTRGNPTMKAKFDEARNAKAIEAKSDDEGE